MPSGPSIGIITLTFSGDMPLKVQTLRPNQNGLPDCDKDNFDSSDGVPGNQYLMVDETVKDDDTAFIETYKVDWGVSGIYQMFCKPLTALPAGSTIEYVKLGAYYKHNFSWQQIEPDWAKMLLYPEYGWQYDDAYLSGSGGGFLKLLLSLDYCSDIASSPSSNTRALTLNDWGSVNFIYPNGDNYFTLFNPYKYISYILTENPDTSLPWTELDVDNIQFGVCGLSSDWSARRLLGENVADTIIDFLPIRDFSHNTWLKYPALTHPNFYEYLPNVDNEYLYSPTIDKPLTFLFNNTDWITYKNWKDSILISVRLSAYVAGDFNHDNTIHFIRVHDGLKTDLNSVAITIGLPNWQHITYDFFTAASWHDIDPAHNLFGIEIHAVHLGGNVAITKLSITELTVDSKISGLRVTQEFLDVAYRESPPIPCRLPLPEWDGIRVNHDIDTTGLNFWSGNRDVFAEGRSSKRTTLSGILWDGCTDGVSTCEDIIHCIRALGKLKQPITIAGLRYADLNVEYNILSFSWKQQSECTNIYDWDLELEFTQ